MVLNRAEHGRAPIRPCAAADVGALFARLEQDLSGEARVDNEFVQWAIHENQGCESVFCAAPRSSFFWRKWTLFGTVEDVSASSVESIVKAVALVPMVWSYFKPQFAQINCSLLVMRKVRVEHRHAAKLAVQVRIASLPKAHRVHHSARRPRLPIGIQHLARPTSLPSMREQRLRACPS